MHKKYIELNITEDQRKKCHVIIHGASVAAGATGAAGAQLPVADNAVIVPTQITMIIALGKVFDLKITESIASGIIKSAIASFVGRGLSQVLVGWVPGIGNVINTATAAGITETIGWMSVKEFSENLDKYEELSAEEKDKIGKVVNEEKEIDEIQKDAEKNRSIRQESQWKNYEVK